jgi:biopolymer transport protein ExbB
MFSGNSFTAVVLSSPTMMVLLVCSIIVVTFALERWWFFARTGISANRFHETMRKYLSRNQLSEFATWCQSGKSSLTRILGVAAENARLDKEAVDQLLDIEMEKEQVHMEKNLAVLGTLANIAPLLGLFGTVVGIIRAFKDIAVTGSGGSSVIAMGVAEALLTTAAGIIVAVIATVFFNVFTRKIRVRSIEVDDARNWFWKYLGRTGAPEGPGAAGK